MKHQHKKANKLHPFRDTFMTVHHLRAKTRGGVKKPNNSLRIWRDKHTAWHILFHNDTLDEIISKMSMNLYKFTRYILEDDKRYQAYRLLWRNQPLVHVLQILKRLRRIKKNLGRHKKV
jgi:hypothetical protein